MERSPPYQLFEVLDTFSLSNFFGFGLYSAQPHPKRSLSTDSIKPPSGSVTYVAKLGNNCLNT